MNGDLSGTSVKLMIAGLMIAVLAVIPGAGCGIAYAVSSTKRVSVSGTGVQGNESSSRASISGNGRYITFVSEASNLVPNDTNGVTDTFVWDRVTSKIVRISVSSEGRQGNRGYDYWGGPPSINAHGRFIAFESMASNLVSGDTNGRSDVFVRDRDTDRDNIYDEPGAVTTARVSAWTNGGSKPSISANGRHVAFVTSTEWAGDRNDTMLDVFSYDRLTGRTALVSVSTDGVQDGGYPSWDPSTSADGRFIAFWSDAPSLVGQDPNDSVADVFVRDRDTDRNGVFDEPDKVRTVLVSVGRMGATANADSVRPFISSSGRYIAFESNATNLVANDTNGQRDIFVRDWFRGTTARISLSTSGVQSNNQSVVASISAHGRYLVFTSRASNLVGNDTNGYPDVFLRDRDTDADRVYDEPGGVSTERINLSGSGSQAKSFSYSGGASISTTGRYATFDSDATNLVSGDTNGSTDVFLRDRGAP